ncbi:MAG: hypothetical protein KKH28_04545 [Elusimicrobia bacterium]|nr:hypothetical protein [Elusimicrobiota bacterium]
MKIFYQLGLAVALVVAVSPAARALDFDGAAGGTGSLMERVSQQEIPAIGDSVRAPDTHGASSPAARETLCEKKLAVIIEDYKNNNRIVKSYAIKDCSSVTEDMGPIFNENLDTNAPKVTKSNACAILLNIEGRSLQEMVIYDDLTGFSLRREFDNPDNEKYSISRLGDTETGSIMFAKLEGKGRNDLGFLKHVKFITRADYDLENDVLRMMKWRLHFFWNSYSHDYTVQCKSVSVK